MSRPKIIHYSSNHREYTPFFLVLSLLAIIGLAAFGGSLRQGFVLDDHFFYQGVTANWGQIFSYLLPDRNKLLGIGAHETNAFYRPVDYLMLHGTYVLFKGSAFLCHCFNLLTHVLAAGCVFLLVRSIAGCFWTGLTASFIYLLHPFNAMMVHYVTASVFSLQVIFMALGLYVFPRRSSLVYYFLALMTHETSMAMPFFVGVLAFSQNGRNVRLALKQTCWFWVMTVVYWLFRLQYSSLQGGILANYAQFHMTIPQYLASMGKLLWWYLAQLLLPFNVLVIYGIHVVKQHTAGWILFLAVFLTAAVLTMFFNRRKPAVFIGLGWFIFGFVPFAFACLFQPSRGPIIEPHWFVFSQTGAFMAIGFLMRRLWLKFRNAAAAVLIGGIFLGLLALNWRYNGLWGNERKYCEYWIGQSPEFAAVYFHLAKACELEGDYAAARRYYRMGLTDRAPDVIRVLSEEGLFDLREGKLDEAMQKFNGVLQIKPADAAALNNMGAALLAKKNTEQAREYFVRSAGIDPAFVLPRLNLAQMALAVGDTNEAALQFESVFKIDPNQEAALVGLIQIYHAAHEKEKVLLLSRRLLHVTRNPLYQKNIAILASLYHDQALFNAASQP